MTGGQIYLHATSDPPMVGIQDQRNLVKVTRMLLQDLVVLGGPIQIPITEGPATALVHLINTLDQGLGRKVFARDMTLVILGTICPQIARIKIIRARRRLRPKQPPRQLRRPMTSETAGHVEVGISPDPRLSK